MCGEHSPPMAIGAMVTGSSPHVRGAPTRPTRQPSRPGIIPACAGSTARPMRHEASPRDHPRMCGEHWYAIISNRHTTGSSPHVRGALPMCPPRPRSDGIIPACAGSTPFEYMRSYVNRDHPRMCGEHYVPIIAAYNLMGSSPHVRGARATYQRDEPVCGIIPACAGSTYPQVSPIAQTRDHPRMCGEHWRSRMTLSGL